MTQKALRGLSVYPGVQISNFWISERYGLSDNIRDYKFVSQAEITVPGMNDTEEWGITDVSSENRLKMWFSDSTYLKTPGRSN